METFKKSALVHTYNWTRYDLDDPRISGTPDTTMFNRTEGLEILYMINYLADHLAYGVDSFGHRIETLIHNRPQEESTTQQDMIAWIKNNWKNHRMATP